MSTRETALQALLALLQTVSGVTVKRNEILPAKIPAGGLIILRDGEITISQTLLSPLRYVLEHRAEVQIVVQHAVTAQRDSGIDTLLAAIGTALAGDPTLGGTVDTAQAEAPQFMDEPVEGAAGIKVATLPVLLEYLADTPIG
jgi:hypothetical protein